MNEIHRIRGQVRPPQPPNAQTRTGQTGDPSTHPTGEVSSTRVLNGQTQTIDKSKLTADDLINGDPELDLDGGGRLPELELPRLISYPGKNRRSRMNSMKSRSCTHREKRNADREFCAKPTSMMFTPLNLERPFPLKKHSSFVFRAVYQLVHDDGIGYEFLHGVAKRLHDKKEVALLGAGPKGNAPLILRDKWQSPPCLSLW